MEGLSHNKGGGSHTILVVEDNEVVLEALADTLGIFGYTVFTATNGADALAIARELERPVDLIVSDYMMPGMNALTMHAALTAVGRAAHMLILTGYPMPFTEMELDDEHEIRWARKPIEAKWLQSLVEEMISQRARKR